MSESTRKCSRCKVSLPIGDFTMKRDRKYKKSCNQCLVRDKKYRKNRKKCPHNKIKSRCILCDGSGICEHKTRRSSCKKCKGVQICPHNKRKGRCVDCEGSGICEHKKNRTICKDCKGGSLCSHNIQRSLCRECGKKTCFCKHDILKRTCKICDLGGYIKQLSSSRIYQALKKNKSLSTIEYLGCDIKTFKNHIEKKFLIGMSWENHGDWHIDHIIPIKYAQDDIPPSIAEICKRLHYTNTQPLWAEDNQVKGNRYIESSDEIVKVSDEIYNMIHSYI